MKNKYIGTLLMLVSATSFALLSINAKFAYLEQVNVNTFLLLRFALAALILWGYIFIKKIPYRLPKKDIFFLTMMGIIGYTAQAKLFFTSLETIPASLAALLLYLYPAIVTIIAFLFKVEKITIQKLVSLTLSAIGLFLVLGISVHAFDLKGAILAISAAIVYSLYILAGNTINHRINPMVLTAYIVSSASTSFIFINLVEGTYSFTYSTAGWAYVFSAVIVSTTAIMTFFSGLKHLGPSQSSIISTFEPIVTVVIAMVLFQEKLLFIQWIGGFLIILSVIFLQLRSKNHKIIQEETILSEVR